MKKLRNGAAVLAMFFIIIGILITSFQIAAYGDSKYRFYEKEYEKYNVTESLDMKMEDVMEVTDYMMDYLIGKEDELSVVTDVDGQKQDFFNEQDRLHMLDVRNLFLGGLKVRTVLFVLAVIFLVTAVIPEVLAKERGGLHKLLFRSYSIAIGVFLAVLAFLGIAFTVDFTACFATFHEIFFTNDLWLFDPATDYMIRMLPEGFFADMTLRIGAIFVGILLVVWAALFVWKRMSLKRKEVS